MESTRYSCHILKKLEFFDTFSKNSQISDFMKVRSVVAELFHAYGQTDIRMEGQRDMTKLAVFLIKVRTGTRAYVPRCTAACRLIVLPLYYPRVLDVPTFAASPSPRPSTRETPSSERWNCVGENRGR
jgi:hypothetical protein